MGQQSSSSSSSSPQITSYASWKASTLERHYHEKELDELPPTAREEIERSFREIERIYVDLEQIDRTKRASTKGETTPASEEVD